MPTAAATRLTRSHRLAQKRIATDTITAMRRIWPLLDGYDLDSTAPAWLDAAVPVIDAFRAESARNAAAYVRAFRAIEIGRGATPVLAGAVAPDVATTSLLVTGPISVKSAVARGVPIVRAMSVAEASSSAAAMRHALNAGRETVTGTLATDQAARGWARVSGGGACKFCSMLAGRGHVYSAGTVDFQAHDGCSCSAEPVYR